MGGESVGSPRAAFLDLLTTIAISDGCDVTMYEYMLKWTKTLKFLCTSYLELVTAEVIF